MRRKFLLGLLAATLGVASLLSCGPYTFNPNLPGHIKSVAIPIFKNPRTFKYGLERKITTALVDAFVRDGTLDVAAEAQADAKLTGEVVSYKKEALSYDVTESVKEYNLVVVVSVSFIDLTTGQVLYQDPNIYQAVSYYAVGPRAETEDEALERLAEELARKIVKRTLQGW